MLHSEGVHRVLHSFPTRRSSDLSAPYVAVMDADLQHDERILTAMLETLRTGKADLVAASRHIKGGSAASLEKRSEEHTSELQSQFHLVCRLLLEKKKIDRATYEE